jgi:hypothetical protein
MQPDPKTTHLLWCDFNSEEPPDDLGGALFSTLAPKTHDGRPLEDRLPVFIFDYDDYENAVIVGHAAVIEHAWARVTTDEDRWDGPLPLGFCRARDDTEWFYRPFPECDEMSKKGKSLGTR